MNSNKFNIDNDSESFSITGSIISQIVKEEDEYTMNIIEEYVKTKRAQGEIISAKIIPEGKLRHIINLGLTIYNRDMKLDELVATDLFPQEQYIEFLRREIMRYQQENQKLKNQITMEKGAFEVEE